MTRFVRNKKAFGRLGKQKNATLYLSPAAGFQERQEEDWPGSHFFINLDDEKTARQTEKFGQVIAIQVNRPAINSPTNCLRALADKINEEIYSFGYYLSIIIRFFKIRRDFGLWLMNMRTKLRKLF